MPIHLNADIRKKLNDKSDFRGNEKLLLFIKHSIECVQ
jgi:hypothetical protein